MSPIKFLTGTRNGRSLDWTDWMSYAYLLVGLFDVRPGALAGGVVIQNRGGADRISAEPCPAVRSRGGAGEEKPKPVYREAAGWHNKRVARSAPHRPDGDAWSIPAKPDEFIRVNVNDREPVREFRLATENYTDLAGKFQVRHLPVEQTGVHHGRRHHPHAAVQLDGGVCAVEVQVRRAEGRVPADSVDADGAPAIVLVPNFSRDFRAWFAEQFVGVIWPAVATPTGVFLLRQYMLTIPDELLEAARMDHASEWKIYWRIVLPLTAWRRRWPCSPFSR